MLQVGQILEGVINGMSPFAPPDQNGVSWGDIALAVGNERIGVNVGVKKPLQLSQPLKVVVQNLGNGTTKLPYVKRWQPPKPDYQQPQGQPPFIPPVGGVQPQQATQFAPQSTFVPQAGQDDPTAPGKIRHGLVCALLSADTLIDFNYLDVLVKYVMTGVHPADATKFVQTFVKDAKSTDAFDVAMNKPEPHDDTDYGQEEAPF